MKNIQWLLCRQVNGICRKTMSLNAARQQSEWQMLRRKKYQIVVAHYRGRNRFMKNKTIS
jgi:hypothetical protein